MRENEGARSQTPSPVIPSSRESFPALVTQSMQNNKTETPMSINWNAPVTAYTAEQLYLAFKERMLREMKPALSPEEREKLEEFLDEAEDDLG